MAGITSVLLVMMLSAPRVFLAMARDGLVPKAFFADVHPRFQTPWKSTILIGIFVGILAGLLPIDALLHLTNIGTLFAFVIVCGAVLIMRRTNPEAPRPFRCPLVPVVPILGIASCLAADVLPAGRQLVPPLRLAGAGPVHLLLLRPPHSILGKELRGEISHARRLAGRHATGRAKIMSSLATPHEGPPPANRPAGFQQRLGLFDATMLVAGTMIGSGIFIVSADIARDVGSTGWLMAVWVLTGVMTIMGALSYAELAAMMPQAGGQYVFLREAYSPLWGFLYGWTCFLVIQTGSIAAVGVAFAKFLGVLVPAPGHRERTVSHSKTST